MAKAHFFVRIFCNRRSEKTVIFYSKLNRCSQVEDVTMMHRQVYFMPTAALTSLNHGRHVGQFVTFHEFVESLTLAENR